MSLAVLFWLYDNFELVYGVKMPHFCPFWYAVVPSRDLRITPFHVTGCTLYDFSPSYWQCSIANFGCKTSEYTADLSGKTLSQIQINDPAEISNLMSELTGLLEENEKEKKKISFANLVTNTRNEAKYVNVISTISYSKFDISSRISFDLSISSFCVVLVHFYFQVLMAYYSKLV